MEIQSFQTSATRIKVNSHLPLQLTRVSTSEPITDSPWGIRCVDSGSHRGTPSPKATPAGAAPVGTMDAVRLHTTSLFQVHEPGFSGIGSEPCAKRCTSSCCWGSQGKGHTASPPPSTGAGMAKNMQGLKGSGWAFPCSARELVHFSQSTA